MFDLYCCVKTKWRLETLREDDLSSVTMQNETQRDAESKIRGWSLKSTY